VQHKLLQVLEQMGDTEVRARPLLIAALIEGNEWSTAAKMAARWGGHTPDECFSWEERGVVQELVAANKIEEALEYAGDKLFLRQLALQSCSTAPSPSNTLPAIDAGKAIEYARLGQEVEVVWIDCALGVLACWNELQELAQAARTGHAPNAIVGLDCEWRHPRPMCLSTPPPPPHRLLFRGLSTRAPPLQARGGGGGGGGWKGTWGEDDAIHSQDQ